MFVLYGIFKAIDNDTHFAVNIAQWFSAFYGWFETTFPSIEANRALFWIVSKFILCESARIIANVNYGAFLHGVDYVAWVTYRLLHRLHLAAKFENMRTVTVLPSSCSPSFLNVAMA